MEIAFLAVTMLPLVTAVYFVAYRSGYKSAQAKAAAAVKDVAAPVSELLERLQQAMVPPNQDEDQTKS